MTRTRITKLDMESPSEAAGKAFVTDGAGNVVVSGIPADGHTHTGHSISGHLHIETDITDILHNATQIQGRNVNAGAPSAGQTYRWSGSDWIPSGVVTVDEQIGEIQEAGAQVATAVSILNFKGTAVNQLTDEGGGKVDIDLSASGSGASVFTGLTDTPASYAGEGGKAVLVKGTADGLEFGEAATGGTDLTLRDEGILLTPSGNSINFTGSAITAVASGTTITVDVPGMPVSVPAFIGARYKWAVETQTTTGYWTSLDWDAVDGDGVVIYNKPDAWEYVPFGSDINVPEQGFYDISASVTISGGAVPALANRNMTLNLFEQGGQTVASDSQLRASGVQTFHINTTIFINSPTDDTSLSLFNAGHNEAIYPYILSGAFTHVAIHKVQGSVVGMDGVRTTQINSGSLTISDDTVTDLDFDTEQYDFSDFWDTGDRATFTIPSSGWYRVQGLVTWDKWGGGSDRKFLIERNGSTTIAAAQKIHPGPNDTKEVSQTLSTDYFFDVGDTVKFRVWHNRGSSLNVIPGNTAGAATHATITKVGRV